MKKILIALISIPFIFFGVWLAVPETSIKSFIEDSISTERLGLEVKGLKKGVFYNLSIASLTLKKSGEELISLDNIHGRLNPLGLIMLRLNLFFNGGIGGGNISGRMNITINKMQLGLDVRKAYINRIPLFKLAGVQGTGTISGRFTMIDDTGHAEFIAKDAGFEPALFSGIAVPLNFFHNIRGAMDIKENIINVVSFALEGKDIHARLKGVIKDSVMSLDLELMPGASFIENPLFVYRLEKYKVSPGYYVIPIRGRLILS